MQHKATQKHDAIHCGTTPRDAMQDNATQGNLKIALRGGDMDARRRRGGGLEKWGSVSGTLFCVRTDVGAEGAGTQNLARKSFFHQ